MFAHRHSLSTKIYLYGIMYFNYSHFMEHTLVFDHLDGSQTAGKNFERRLRLKSVTNKVT